ncbi:MAG: cyclic nucleotide-binding domain-containing protein, partial [Anaerolineales bacterium]|nr:cyclic nucleotide-binding domain-containing protein [Anaerolineales bacterium]
MSQEFTRLKSSFLFQGLPDDVLEALVQKVIRRKFHEGETIIRRGDEGDALYIIDHGWVKIVTVDKQGGELVINRCGPGEAIGEMSLFDKEPRSAGVISLADTEVLELKQDAFFELLNQRPDLSLNLIR